MKHFIIDENGASSLLATALDPTCGKTRNRTEFIRLFTNRISNATGAELTATGPKICVREHWGIDIVCSWGKWLVLIENKVKASSVTPGQLQLYYKLGKDTIMKDSIGRGTQKILLVYLTPGRYVGQQEFEGLRLTTGDEKIHLSWNEVLRDLSKAFGKSKEVIITSSIPLVKKLLAEGRKRETFERTPNRTEMKNQLSLIRTKVEHMLAGKGELRLHGWRDELMDSMFGNLDGRNGNVYLALLSDGTDLMNDGNAKLRFMLQFWVANKASSITKQKFAKRSLDDWARLLTIPKDQLDTSELSRYRINMLGIRTGPLGSWTDELAELYCRFMIAFKPFMATK